MSKTLNFKKTLDKIKSNKKLQYLILAFLISIILLSLLIINFANKNESVDTDAINSYVISLENRLAKALEKVEGVGYATVVITVESGMETVLAMKTTTTTTSSGTETIETPILVNGKTVVLKELYPKITGVLIVAKGADNIFVLNKIQQATVSLLDINVNKIEILTMK